jgi:type I restriction enzyme S subunit
VRITDINDEGGLRDETFKSLPAEIAEPYLLHEGDVLLARSGATVGKSFIYSEEWGTACFAGYLIRARLRASECLPRWVYYFCQTDGYWGYIVGSQIQATIQNVSAEKYANLYLPLPPLDEQQAISSFLDVETSKIDGLVSEQRRLIELLKEKRQAVISHAVTKGLNPHAPMKPSGIQWLGDVPAHWEVTRFGWVCDYISYGFTNPMPTADEGPYMLTANDVDYGNVKYETARCTTLDAFENLLTDKCRPIKDDLLLTKDGTLGRIAVHDGRQACINQSVALLRVAKAKVNPKFACLALQGGLYQRRMIYEAGGTTIKHIYISRLAKMPMAFPDLDEQGNVVEYLNDRLATFDGLIAEAERAIELLQERRTALISAAVTGKIDVRNYAPAEAV